MPFIQCNLAISSFAPLFTIFAHLRHRSGLMLFACIGVALVLILWYVSFMAPIFVLEARCQKILKGEGLEEMIGKWPDIFNAVYPLTCATLAFCILTKLGLFTLVCLCFEILGGQ
ncbi:hypothetical protein EDB19DRAFT_1715153 [Suillus lakei]|nr:hypothetical protein EDB19DRAFT_1715153 [Suillus lakei]